MARRSYGRSTGRSRSRSYASRGRSSGRRSYGSSRAAPRRRSSSVSRRPQVLRIEVVNSPPNELARPTQIGQKVAETSPTANKSKF